MLHLSETKQRTMNANTKIQVDEKVYNKIRNYFAGIVAHRKENGKFYIKIMFASYCNMVEGFIKSL